MALTGVFLILLCVGRYSVPPSRAFRIMGVALFRDGQALEALKAENPFGVSVILGSRLPRLLMGMIVGAGLSVAGATYQAIFGNPLVSPDILGSPPARVWSFFRYSPVYQHPHYSGLRFNVWTAGCTYGFSGFKSKWSDGVVYSGTLGCYYSGIV
ncbi:MAG: iron chelate uptake ABC transporter family permease subunit [Enterocloster clostridioformis]